MSQAVRAGCSAERVASTAWWTLSDDPLRLAIVNFTGGANQPRLLWCWKNNKPGSTAMQCRPHRRRAAEYLPVGGGWPGGSAPTRSSRSLSQIDDSSLAKAIFTSRKLFSVSLAISAVRAVVVMQSPCTNSLYRSRGRFASSVASSRRSPIVLDQFAHYMAGQHALGAVRDCEYRIVSPAGWERLRSGRASASHAAICSVVAPTGEVDSRTTRSPFFSTGAIDWLADWI